LLTQIYKITSQNAKLETKSFKIKVSGDVKQVFDQLTALGYGIVVFAIK